MAPAPPQMPLLSSMPLFSSSHGHWLAKLNPRNEDLSSVIFSTKPTFTVQEEDCHPILLGRPVDPIPYKHRRAVLLEEIPIHQPSPLAA